MENTISTTKFVFPFPMVCDPLPDNPTQREQNRFDFITIANKRVLELKERTEIKVNSENDDPQPGDGVLR